MKTIGIDMGTTTISLAVYDTVTKNAICTRTVPNDCNLESEFPWEKIQDPVKILQKVTSLLDELLHEYDDIKGIGLTGQMHGILYLDQEGNQISPLYTWQDERGNEKCFQGKSVCELLQEKGVKGCYSGYGLITHIYNTLQHIVPQNATKICTMMDYVGMVLTKRTEPLVHSSNAASFGLYDAKNVTFMNRILDQVRVSTDILPKVTARNATLGYYQGIPVCVAIGDNQASFLGAVDHKEESILINMGTGGQISVYGKRYFDRAGIETRPFDENGYLYVGASLCGGRAYEILKNFFQSYGDAMHMENVDHYAVMEEIIAAYPWKNKREEHNQLKINTMFSGTREKPESRGSIQNIGIDNCTPGDIIYGVLEGMTEELYEFYQIMQSGMSINMTNCKKYLVASGNGIRKNRYLQEMMSERFQMPIHLAEREEEAACGAAIFCQSICVL